VRFEYIFVMTVVSCGEVLREATVMFPLLRCAGMRCRVVVGRKPVRRWSGSSSGAVPLGEDWKWDVRSGDS